jgi:hypothetical protein
VQLEIKKKKMLKREKTRKQEAYTNDILTHDLWQSEVGVDNMLTASLLFSVISVSLLLNFFRSFHIHRFPSVSEASYPMYLAPNFEVSSVQIYGKAKLE